MCEHEIIYYLERRVELMNMSSKLLVMIVMEMDTA